MALDLPRRTYKAFLGTPWQEATLVQKELIRDAPIQITRKRDAFTEPFVICWLPPNEI
jgi:hypothetical protein